jgi:hypothetical protein
MKILLFIFSAVAVLGAPPEPKFKAQDLDKGVQIGYGVAVADVDGDKLPDILLADKKQFRWYKNPGKRDASWASCVMAENLTAQDNVCIAAQDIDGDGRCEVAVGAEWNPADTVSSGAVFYLIAPADRTQPWEAVKFPSVEPTTHRMRWVPLAEKEWGLLVAPLHGRGNKDGEGAGVKVLLYRKPADPKTEWSSEVIDDTMHATHSIDVVLPEKSGAPTVSVGVAGKEGVVFLRPDGPKWKRPSLDMKDAAGPDFNGAGDVRAGFLTGAGELFFACIEPMHGNRLAVYRADPSTNPPSLKRTLLTDKLIQGHALACGDLLGLRSDQVVVGWRGNQPGHDVGIAVWTALDERGEQWRETVVDHQETACEDLTLADLDGDGKLDIIASGRASHNLRVFWNERP